jgi:hypothetical protein
MDPVSITLQLKRDFEMLTSILAQQEQKILELQQNEQYYKTRITHLEADLIEMAENIEKLETTT